MFLFNQMLVEADTNPGANLAGFKNEDSQDDSSNETDDQDYASSMSASEPPDLQPVKKFDLVQRLFDMKRKLVSYNIHVDELDTLLNFADSLSYSTIVNLGTIIATDIEQKLKELSKKNEK